MRAKGLVVGSGAILLAVLAGPAAAQAPSWKVAQGDVRVAVPLRPGGGFEAKTSALTGTLTLAAPQPVALSGELTVDLATIDTGIDLRNRHLREKYLEVAKPGFDKAVLSEIRLPDANGETFEGRSGFTATLRLHGVSRPLTGTAEIHREGTAVRVVASFAILLPDFGIEPPEYMGVGVGSKLGVRVTVTAGRGAAR